MPTDRAPTLADHCRSSGSGAIIESTTGDRIVRVSFSSESRVQRSYGIEVLSHAAGDVDLTNINEMGVLLYNHDQDKHIGRVVSAWVKDGRGYADVEFDSDEFSETIFQKVKKGSLRGVSFFYDWDAARSEVLRPGELSADGRHKGPCVVRHGWFPLELSIVTVPGDFSVGVGRSWSFTGDEESREVNMPTENDKLRTAAGAEGAEDKEAKNEQVTDEQNAEEKKGAAESGKPDEKDEEQKKRSYVPGGKADDAPQDNGIIDAQRMMTIMELCEGTNVSAADCIRSNLSMKDIMQRVMDDKLRNHAPIAAGRVDISDEADKKRAAMVDAILVRGGVKDIKDCAPGTNRYMRKHTRDLFGEAYMMEGMSRAEVEDMSDTDLLRRYVGQATRSYMTPTAMFPAILDDAAEKAIVAGYARLPLRYEKISRKVSVKDFKEHRHNYVFGGAVAPFKKLPEGGTIEHNEMQMDMLPSVRTETYASQFTMTRELIVNDDIGLVAESTYAMGEKYRETINDMVYDVYLENQNCYDGTPLLSGAKGHKNLMAKGTTVTAEDFNDALRILAQQTDQFGQRIAFRPGILLVPVAYEKDAYQLFNSPTINTTDNTQAANPWYNYGVEVVADGTIDARVDPDAPLPWFLIAQGYCPVELAYLNGNEGLDHRAMEMPGKLGVVVDYWGDVGVNVTDWRSIVGNPGIVKPLSNGLAK